MRTEPTSNFTFKTYFRLKNSTIFYTSAESRHDYLCKFVYKCVQNFEMSYVQKIQNFEP